MGTSSSSLVSKSGSGKLVLRGNSLRYGISVHHCRPQFLFRSCQSHPVYRIREQELQEHKHWRFACRANGDSIMARERSMSQSLGALSRQLKQVRAIRQLSACILNVLASHSHGRCWRHWLRVTQEPRTVRLWRDSCR